MPAFVELYDSVPNSNIAGSCRPAPAPSHIQLLEVEDLKYRLQGASEYHIVMFNLSLTVTALSWLRAAAAL